MANMKSIMIILTISIFLASCDFEPTPLNCNQIEELVLPEEEIMSTDLDGIHDQIVDTYGLQREDIRVTEWSTEEISTIVDWEHERKAYTASFEQGRLRRVLVRLRPNTVRFGAVLDCLPEPTYYYFTSGPDVETWRHDFDLWYPELRLVLSTVKFQNTHEPLSPDERLAVTYAIWVPDSSVENMAIDLFPHADRAHIREILLLVKEWPGSLDLLEPDQPRTKPIRYPVGGRPPYSALS